MTTGTHIVEEANQSSTIEAAIADRFHVWSPYVCQIGKDRDSHVGGTGILIAPGLVLTCCHVLLNQADPTKDELMDAARKSHAVFCESFRISLNPDTFFAYSHSPGDHIVDSDSKLDYAVIALKQDHLPEEILRINQTVRSIFEDSILGPSMSGMSGVGMIHYPSIHGQRKKKYYGRGMIMEHRNRFNLYHQVKTEGGSSGALLFNDEGQLLGIHRGAQGNTTHEGIKYGTAVPVELIRESLRPYQERIELLSLEIKPAYVIARDLRNQYRKEDFDIELPMSEEKIALRDFFTSLVLIKSETQKKKEEEESHKKDPLLPERDSLVEAHARITQSDESIEIQDIFKKDQNNKTPKKILIVGRAGVGKTTLVNKITFDWLNGEIFQEFDVVYRLPLRNLNGMKKLEKAEDSNEWIARAVASEIFGDRSRFHEIENHLKDHKNRVLLLLDGLDEADKKLCRQIDRLLKDKEVHILVVSRPAASLKSRREFDRRIENIGFSDHCIEDYCQRFFLNDQKKKEFLQALKKGAIFYSLAHTPLHLQMLVNLWEGGDEKFPATLTKLYSKMVGSLWDWNWNHLGVHPDEVSVERKAAINEVLGRIAAVGLDSGRLMIPKTFIEDLLRDSGVKTVKELEDTGLLKVTGEFCYFLHLTYQEYFVALSVSQQGPDVWRAFVRENGFKAQYALVMSFLAGLIHQKDSKSMASTKLFFDILREELGDLSGGYQMKLTLRCLEECDRKESKNWALEHPVVEKYFAIFEAIFREKKLQNSLKLIRLCRYFRSEIWQEKFFAEPWLLMTRAFEDVDRKVRLAVLEALLEIAKDQSLPEQANIFLIEALQDSEDEVRFKVAMTLGEVRRKKELPKEQWDQLMDSLASSEENEEQNIRKFFAQLLRHRDLDESVWSLIFNLLGRSDFEKKLIMMHALSEIVKTQIVPERIWSTLSEASKDSNQLMRLSTLQVGKEIICSKQQSAERAWSLLLSASTDPELIIRERLLDFLYYIEIEETTFPDKAYLFILKSLNDPERQVRYSAARMTFRRLNSKDLVIKAWSTLLNTFINTKDHHMRSLIARNLQFLGHRVKPAFEWSFLFKTLLKYDFFVSRAIFYITEVMLLGEPMPEEALDNLLELIKDSEIPERLSLLSLLGKILEVKDLPEERWQMLIEGLNDPEWEVRAHVTHVLGEIGEKKQLPEKAKTMLFNAFKDSDWRVRRVVISSVIKAYGGKKEISENTFLLLCQALDAPKWELRATGVLSLAEKEELSREIKLKMIKLLGDPEKDVRISVARGLENILKKHRLTEECWDSLIIALAANEEEVRVGVSEALKETLLTEGISDKFWLSLIYALGDSDWRVQSNISWMLKKLRDKEELPENAWSVIIERFHHSDIDIRCRTYNALRTIGQDKELPQKILISMIAALDENEKDVRKAVAETLRYIPIGETDSPDSIWSPLVAALSDSEAKVSEGVTHFFRKLRNKKELPEKVWFQIVTTLINAEIEVQSRICKSLIELGKGKLLPESIWTCLNGEFRDLNNDVRTRFEIAKAIGEIGSERELPSGVINSFIDFALQLNPLVLDLDKFLDLNFKSIFFSLCCENNENLNEMWIFKTLMLRSNSHESPMYFKAFEGKMHLCLLDKNQEISHPVTEEQKAQFIEWARNYSPFGDCFV